MITRCLDGDPDAVEDLVGAVRDRIYRLALRMTACPEDAQDATQEILIKVLTRLDTFRGEAAPTTWVHRIAVNHLLDRRKSRVERLGFTFETFADDLLSGLAAPPERSSPDLDLLADEVRRGCTLAVLTCLDRPSRLAYILGEVLQIPASTGAEICDVSEATYRKRLSRPVPACAPSCRRTAGWSTPMPRATAAGVCPQRSRRGDSTPTPHGPPPSTPTPRPPSSRPSTTPAS